MFATFEAGLRKVQSSLEYTTLTKQGRRPKIIVIVDALSSTPGLLMPWERVVELCKQQENVWSLVDAAHAIGQVVGINLNKTQPDFFISVGTIYSGWWPRLILRGLIGLSQVVVLKARKRGSLYPTKVVQIYPLKIEY